MYCGEDLYWCFANNAFAQVHLWGPVQTDTDIFLIEEEGTLDDVLCVTPLAFWNPSGSSGFNKWFNSKSSIDENNLGVFVEMDHESSGEDLDFFVTLNIAASETSGLLGALLLGLTRCIILVLTPLSEGPLRK